MSKYLSKGGEVLSQSNPELLPSAWYTLSTALKGIIKSTVLRGNSHLAEQLHEHIFNGELLSWSRDVYSPEHGDGSRYLIAWVGQIRTRGKFWEVWNQLNELLQVPAPKRRVTYNFSF